MGTPDLLPQPRRLTVEEVIQLCCNALDINILALRGNRRGAEMAEKRQLIAHLACTLFGHSASAVARGLNRDHTTVAYGLTAIKMRMSGDAELAGKVKQLSQFLTYKAHEPVPVASIIVKPVKAPSRASLPELLVRIPNHAELRRNVEQLRKRGGTVESIAKRLGQEPRVVAHFLGVQWGDAA